MADETDARAATLELASEVVVAYVSNNNLSATDLPKLIADVFQALNSLDSLAVAEPAAAEQPKPAVSIRKSVTPDYLVCLDDGKKFKSLKRHLSQLGMTPAEYRAKWDLPSDYPMVAPNYAATRSELARKNGLGRSSNVTADAPAPVVKKPRARKRATA